MEKRITDAIVVRVVDYGEADRVVTLITRDAGKVAALARGARRSRKRFGGALELFGSGQAILVERRGDLWSLESFHAQRGFPHLGLEMAKLAHAAYACELTRELATEHDPEPRLHALLGEMLELLDGGAARAELLRVFELRLLDVVGLRPSLDACVGCGAAGGARFDVRRGGVLCRGCADAAPGIAVSPSAIAALRAAQSSALADAHRLCFAAVDGDAVRDVMQAILLEHLGKPLRTVEFIAKLNAHG